MKLYFRSELKEAGRGSRGNIDVALSRKRAETRKKKRSGPPSPSENIWDGWIVTRTQRKHHGAAVVVWWVRVTLPEKL